MATHVTLEVTGMSCTGCEDTVESVVRDVRGVRDATADHEAGTVTVTGDDDLDEGYVVTAIHNSGYEVAT